MLKKSTIYPISPKVWGKWECTRNSTEIINIITLNKCIYLLKLFLNNGIMLIVKTMKKIFIF